MVRRRPRRAPLAAVLALLALALAAAPARAATIEYWIAAVNTEWDLAPNGGDPVMGTRVPAAERRFTAVVYKRFTRDWKRPWPNTGAVGDNDGIPGPTIRASVGDRVLVHFRNLDRAYRIPHSMHFHAFRYAPSSDGAFIPYVSGRDGKVPYRGSVTYRLTAVADSVGVWPYHDHSVDMVRSIALGLYGAIVIRARDERPPDREFLVYLSNHNGFDTINGRAFIGNVPTFHARVGQQVEWQVLALGEDMHVFHIHGHRWRADDGRPVDSQLIGPSSTLQIRFREDAPGTWYYHCHVESHQENGMIGLYRVSR
jgi:FtsP/CotA-like multicopper oxidase with cupredoxin domain